MIFHDVTQLFSVAAICSNRQQKCNEVGLEYSASILAVEAEGSRRRDGGGDFKDDDGNLECDDAGGGSLYL